MARRIRNWFIRGIDGERRLGLMEIIVESIMREIEDCRKSKRRFLVAIDGRCAAGKTTLASELMSRLPCNVIHMDHFYLRPEQRTKERLREPGGNVDYERLLDEVLLPLINGKDVEYRPYDCRRLDFSDAICLADHAINIIEGSYSCHPSLRDHYDLSVFLSVSPEEQIRRIRQREGDDRVADFIEKWIPLEERYFERCSVCEHCDLLFATDDACRP